MLYANLLCSVQPGVRLGIFWKPKYSPSIEKAQCSPSPQRREASQARVSEFVTPRKRTSSPSNPTPPASQSRLAHIQAALSQTPDTSRSFQAPSSLAHTALSQHAGLPQHPRSQCLADIQAALSSEGTLPSPIQSSNTPVSR